MRIKFSAKSIIVSLLCGEAVRLVPCGERHVLSPYQAPVDKIDIDIENWLFDSLKLILPHHGRFVPFREGFSFAFQPEGTS